MFVLFCGQGQGGQFPWGGVVGGRSMQLQWWVVQQFFLSIEKVVEMGVERMSLMPQVQHLPMQCSLLRRDFHFLPIA